MKASFVLLLFAVCVGCAGDPAHRDCDRKLVPINGTELPIESDGDRDRSVKPLGGRLE